MKLTELLQHTNLTLAVAESLTGGTLQARITANHGVSSHFLGGITAYHIDQKVKHLGVDREHAQKVNCVSQEVANQMALGAGDQHPPLYPSTLLLPLARR